MRPISDYLKKLLYQYDCLVVPALGAFLTHGVSASYNETTGQFLPPRRKVAFNEALRLDDGILLNYIALHEQCSREEALQAVNAFVADLKIHTRLQGSFVIDGLGMFSLNSEERLQFDPELRHNFLGNAYGMQPLMLTRQMVHPAIPLIEKPAIVRVLPVTALAVVEKPAVTEVGVVIPMPDSRPRTQPVWRWVATIAVVGALGVISYFSVIQPERSLQSSLNPGSLFHWPFQSANEEKAVSTEPTATPLPDGSAESSHDVNSPSSDKVIAALAFAEPVATPAATPAPTTPVAPAPVAVPAVKAKPTVAKKSEVAAQPVTDAAAPAADPFTVIAGSFANRNNAIRFQKRLRQAGYENAYIMPGRTKGLIKVAALGTDDVTLAQASLDSLNELTGIRPWVLRRR